MSGRNSLFATLLLVIAGCGQQSPPPAEVSSMPSSAPEATTAGAAFDATVEQLSLAYFRQVPEAATYNGAPALLAPDAGERLNDRSVAGERAKRAELESQLAALQATASDPLTSAQQQTRATLIALIDGALGPTRVVDYGTSFGSYGVWFLPYAISHNSGPTVDVPSLLEAQHSVRNLEDAQRYLTRLDALVGVLDGALDKLRHDVALGAIPPDFIVEKARLMAEGFAQSPAADNVLVSSFAGKLQQAGIVDPEATDLTARATSIVAEGVLPAYRRIAAYLAEIHPQAPSDAGIWRLPNGAALYRAMIRHMTDSELEPAAVHEIGLAEVARISAEMDVLLRAQGYTEGSVGERMVALAAEPRFAYPNTAAGKAALLADIQAQLTAVRAALPQWFGKLPKHEVDVRAVPEFSQDSAPGGYYDAPAPDGSRPGIYWINLRDTAAWPRYAVATLTYHEAIPGHHLQVAIAIDAEGPFLAKSFYSNASGEGWALYAEALAAEMGLYADDPFGDLGRLQAEMHRAVRLVVDTGMHEMRWSRAQAIDYMVANEGAARAEAESEIDRYTVWPGQALGYKLGMLKLQALRQEAKAAFGERFDIREFHDRLLQVSSAAMPVIESELRAWIATAGEDD